MSALLGRPPLPDEKKQKVRGVRLDDKQWRQFRELGGLPWLRQIIDRTHARSQK